MHIRLPLIQTQPKNMWQIRSTPREFRTQFCAVGSVFQCYPVPPLEIVMAFVNATTELACGVSFELSFWRCYV